MSFLPIQPYPRSILSPLQLSPTSPNARISDRRFREPSTSASWASTTHIFQGTGSRAISKAWPPEKFGQDPVAIPDADSFNIPYDAETAKPRDDGAFRMFDSSSINTDDVPVPSLVVKRYIPKQQTNTGEGITLLLLPGMGVPKEMLEPFLEVLLRQLQAKEVPVKEVWNLDMPLSGETALVNPIGYFYGNEKDITRDILLFITAYLPLHPGQYLPERLQPRHPTSGRQPVRPNLHVMAHSLGAQCAMLASAHAPDLFSSLSVMDPAMIPGGKINNMLSKLPKDVYCTMIAEQHSDRESLAAALTANKRTRGWDEPARRVFADRGAIPTDDGKVKLVAPPRLEWALYYDKETPTHCYDRIGDIKVPFNAVMPARPFAVPAKMFEVDVGKMKQRTRITWVEGATHQIPYERTGECAEAVAAWLGDVSKGPAAKL